MTTMNHPNIESLQADIEMLKEIAKSYSVDLIAQMKSIFEEYLTIPAKALVVKSNIKLGLSNELVMNCQIGFWNEEEQRVDFGSDVTLDFTIEAGLRINYSIIGYVGKQDIYQMQKLNLFGLFYNNYNTIDGKLRDLMTKAQPYYDICIEIQEKELELHDQLSQIVNTHITKIYESLKVGQKLRYVTSEQISATCRLLGRTFFRIGDEWEITKLTKTYVYCKNITRDTSEEKVRRDDVARAIATNSIEIVGE